jgi:hypothetical protein
LTLLGRNQQGVQPGALLRPSKRMQRFYVRDAPRPTDLRRVQQWLRRAGSLSCVVLSRSLPWTVTRCLLLPPEAVTAPGQWLLEGNEKLGDVLIPILAGLTPFSAPQSR